MKGQEETHQLLEKYPISNLNHALLSFVATARGALGPNMLKVVFRCIHLSDGGGEEEREGCG